MSTQTLKQVKPTLITAGVDSHKINCVLPKNIKKIQICIYKNGLLKSIYKVSLNDDEKALLNDKEKIQFYLKYKYHPQNIILNLKTETNETFRFSLDKYCHTIKDINFVSQDTHESKHYFLRSMTEDDLLLHCMKKLVESAFGSFTKEITSPAVESFQTIENIDVH